jgi:hypothetical protein
MKNAHVVSLLVLLVLFFSIFTCSNAQPNSANTLSDTIAHPSGIQLLESMENALVSIAERSSPAVVSITALDGKRKGVHAWERNFDRRDGTGFIFRRDGYILPMIMLSVAPNRLSFAYSVTESSRMFRWLELIQPQTSPY